TDPRLEAALEKMREFSANLNSILSPIQLSGEIMRSISDLTKIAIQGQSGLEKIAESIPDFKDLYYSSVIKVVTPSNNQGSGYISAGPISLPSFVPEVNYISSPTTIVIEVID